MSEEATVRADADRYTLVVEGTDAGFTQFFDREDGARVFFHTEVAPAFAGRGLAGTLVAGALDGVRGRGLRFVAVCPYVRRFLGTHPEYSDIRDEADAAALAGVPPEWLPDDLKSI